MPDPRLLTATARAEVAKLRGVNPLSPETTIALRDHIAAREEQIAELLRELPCGCHPRLLSLGKPAAFTGGCEAPVIASLAIVCADCGAWYCSRGCISKHFGNEPSEAITSKNQQIAAAVKEAEGMRHEPLCDHWDSLPCNCVRGRLIAILKGEK